MKSTIAFTFLAAVVCTTADNTNEEPRLRVPADKKIAAINHAYDAVDEMKSLNMDQDKLDMISDVLFTLVQEESPMAMNANQEFAASGVNNHSALKTCLLDGQYCYADKNCCSGVCTYYNFLVSRCTSG